MDTVYNFFFLGKWVDFQNYFYFSTELQNLVNTYIPCISEFPWVWLRHHTGRCRCWLSSYFLNLCPMSIANCTKNYSRAYFIYNFCTLWLWATYISHFIESPILFGLYTYRYIPQQQKNKIPKGGEKDLPGWCQWTQTGTSELGARGGGRGAILYLGRNRSKTCSMFLLLLLAPPTRFSYLPAALTETIPRLSNRAVRTMGEIPFPKYWQK